MNSTLEKSINYIFGLSSFLSLVVTIVFSYIAYQNKSTISYREVLFSLTIIVFIFCVTFIISSLYYVKNLEKIKNIHHENFLLKQSVTENEVFAKNTAEYIYNFIIYSQKLHFILGEGVEKIKKNTLTENEVNSIYEDFHSFLMTFTSNLHSYFTLKTKDNSAITIKIVNSKKQVKTFFRDPVSYRKRRASDFENGTEIVSDLNKNFGFLVITSDDYKDSSYCNDNLI